LSTPSPAALAALLEAVRGEARPGDWSAGVELARRGAVTVVSVEEDEVEVRVQAPAGAGAYLVTLWPQDDEWDCECAFKGACCGHAAAGAIALSQGLLESSPAAPEPAPEVRIRYELVRDEGALTLHRVVHAPGDRDADKLRDGTRLHGSLADVPPGVIVTPGDREIDRALRGRWGRRLPRERVPAVVRALVRAQQLTLDGEPVRASRVPVLPVARIQDDGEGGFWVRLVADPAIDEIFRNGFVRTGDEVRAVGDPGLGERAMGELRAGRRFGPGDKAELVSELLPTLRAQRIPLLVESARLPTLVDVPPRLVIETATDAEDRLVVRAAVVYGDPPLARVEGDRLVVTGAEVPRRDQAEERRLGHLLQRHLGAAARRLGGDGLRARDEEAVGWAQRLASLEADVAASGAGVSIAGEAHRGWYLADPIEADLRWGEGAAGGVCMDLRFRTADGRTADPARVLGAWRRGGSLAPLTGGGWAPLPTGWLQRHGDLVADLLAARDERDELPRAVLADAARLAGDLGLDAPPPFADLRALVDGFAGLPAPRLPEDLRATLRGYQREGVAWLQFLRDAELGALLADDMGLGKTLQALCAVRGRALVVAPTSVLPNWAAEAARFRPSLAVNVYHGPKRSLAPKPPARGEGGDSLTLTTYALLRLDQDELAAVDWDVVILDEAQAIKNPTSQVARAAFRLSARWRLAMTGTPVENRLDELWSQLHFASRGLLGGREDFDQRYGRPIAAGDEGVAARLRARIRPFVLRRRKREVAPELPPRTDLVQHVELSPEERAVYDAIRAATQRDVVARLRGGGSVMEALEALLRLRQAACHPALIPSGRGGEPAEGRAVETSSKIALLAELLDEVVSEGSKALIFSQWTSLLDLVEPALRGAGVAFTRLDGSTRDRGAVVEAFQRPEGPPAMLLSLKAGGTGLNLTAADHVFLLDPWWNPATEDQAADRAHRIGQDRPVFVHRLVARDTVEERILALQARKRALAEAALGEAGARGAGRAGAALTREDLLGLLA